MLRARVTGVEGRETKLESFEDVRERGSLGREYTVTYRDHLEPNETVVEGAFWNSPSTGAEVSMEEGLRERFNIHVGDTVRFDILGPDRQRAGDERQEGRVARCAEAAASCSSSGRVSWTTRRR